MNEEKVSEFVNRYFDAYNTKNRNEIEPLLSEHFSFTSPYDDHIDRERYFEHCWPMNKNIKQLTIENIMTENDKAFVTYRLETLDGKKIHNTELLTFEGDKVKSVEVFFGREIAGLN